MKISKFNSIIKNWRGQYVMKPMVLDDSIIEDESSGPPWIQNSPQSEINQAYWWAPILEETRRDGFTFGCVTSWENPHQDTMISGGLNLPNNAELISEEKSCSLGDAFIEGPNGMRAGIFWEIATKKAGALHCDYQIPVDREAFAKISEVEPNRWGVWYIVIKRNEPVQSRQDLVEIFEKIRHVFEIKYQEIFNDL